MKSEYQQLRDILDAMRYPVDPGHEAEFRTLLLNDKKRGRRNVLWFFLCCSGMLIAGYGLISTIRNLPATERFFDAEIAPDSQVFRSTPTEEHSTTSPLSSDPQAMTTDQSESSETEVKDINSGAETNAGQHGESTVTPESGIVTEKTASQRSVKSNLKTNDVKTNNTLQHKKAQATKSSTSSQKNSTSSPLQQEKPNTTDAVTNNPDNFTSSDKQLSQSNSSSTVSKSANNSESESKIADSEAKEDAVQNAQQAPHDIVHQEQLNHDEQLMNTPAAPVSLDTRKTVEATPIIPSTRGIHFHKVHYGVAASVFPAGNLFKKSTLKTGYGYQAGGYATYRLTPRTQLRADAGLSVLDGGFTYIKQSTSQQYGFSVVNEDHTFDVKKLYSGFVSTELGLKRGKNLLCVGVLGQFLYGARGNITSIVQGQVEAPVVLESNNVWLSTKDMQKISLQGTIAFRSNLTRRLQLAAMVRIPITNTVRAPKDASQYTFQVKSHGISPQLSMSYQINQQ